MSRLSLNVHSKLINEFDQVPQASAARGDRSHSPAVEAMLCGFILEGEPGDFAADKGPKEDRDWYYNL
ncbi:MAG: hypothetical protein IPM23_23565 [Candidatus Melainabacteria bacterium]|nr:hypothetical protein [Candidatus Melainabacteria bacterium]